MDLYKEVYNFVKISTKKFDKSHGIEHALHVYKNAMIIYSDYITDNQLEYDIIMFAAMLHDVCDHKYKDKSISEDTLKDFILNRLDVTKTNIIMDIIDNISYSKEVKGLRQNVHQPYLDIISDADKLEALGKKGIERCFEYNKAMYPDCSEEETKTMVLQHCRDKLLNLINYIRTDCGKAMAAPLHKVMVDWVFENS